MSEILWVGTGVEKLPDAWRVDPAVDAAAAVARLETNPYDAVVITDLAALDPILDLRAPAPVLVYDPQAQASDAARYLRRGADDVAGRDDSLLQVLATMLTRREPQLSSDVEPWRRMLVGQSPALTRAAEIIRLVAPRRSTVLITGETGTGKELFARALHMAGPRGHLPMVTVNIAALPENLLEAELFGHVKGAFTGALNQRIGRFEQAHRSTLFLDEIGDMPLDLQTKLLRFLQEREFQRIGSSETLHVDVRLVAATNVDLEARVREGKFREDLFYRLNVVPMEAPPLRQRLEDIPALAEHFSQKICRQEEIPARRFTPEAMSRLRFSPWPGNIRQLENAVEMAVAMSGTRELLGAVDFASLPAQRAAIPAGAPISVPESGLDFDGTVENIERKILEDALRKTNGNKTAAAEMLGLKRTTLSAKLKSLTASAA